MCLIAFHWLPNQSLTLAANRDEFFHRQAAPLAQWADLPHIYAGRDLSQNGTWLGVSQNLRFAALTNVRAPGVGPAHPPSRGELVARFLSSHATAADFAQHLLLSAEQYAPFNLLFGNLNQLWYLTNYPKPNAYEISAGTHALSNAQLDIPWPKVQLAQHQLDQWLLAPHDSLSLAQLLSSRETYPDEQLPDTGVPLELERALSAQFIHLPQYGTRCSTGLLLTPEQAKLTEISWSELGLESSRQQLLIDCQ